VEEARARVRRWLDDRTVARPYVEAWRALLERPQEELMAALSESSEHMHDLRQVSPFAGVLDPRARWRIRDEVRAEMARETR